MSFSVNVTRPSSDEVKAEFAAQLESQLASQGAHKDKDTILAATNAYIDALKSEHDGKNINVNVYGSVSWQGSDSSELTAASLTINVSLVNAAGPLDNVGGENDHTA